MNNTSGTSPVIRTIVELRVDKSAREISDSDKKIVMYALKIVLNKSFQSTHPKIDRPLITRDDMSRAFAEMATRADERVRSSLGLWERVADVNFNVDEVISDFKEEAGAPLRKCVKLNNWLVSRETDHREDFMFKRNDCFSPRTKAQEVCFFVLKLKCNPEFREKFLQDGWGDPYSTLDNDEMAALWRKVAGTPEERLLLLLRTVAVSSVEKSLEAAFVAVYQDRVGKLGRDPFDMYYLVFIENLYPFFEGRLRVRIGLDDPADYARFEQKAIENKWLPFQSEDTLLHQGIFIDEEALFVAAQERIVDDLFSHPAFREICNSLSDFKTQLEHSPTNTQQKIAFLQILLGLLGPLSTSPAIKLRD